MATQIYGLKNCDTCRKALKMLTAAGHSATLIDVRADGIDGAKLAAFYEAFGEKLMNIRSTTWRQLDDEERGNAPLDLIKAHPSLMKRPVIETDAGLTLGFDKSVQAQLGL